MLYTSHEQPKSAEELSCVLVGSNRQTKSPLLLGTLMNSACTPYGKYGVQAESWPISPHNLAGRTVTTLRVLASPASTGSTIRRRMGLKPEGRWRIQHAHIA